MALPAELERLDDSQVDPDDRTPDRDDAADKLEELIGTADWPMTQEEAAERIGYSRQHLRNVLRAYYRNPHETQSRQSAQTTHDGSVSMDCVSIPDDIDDVSAYLRGLSDGVDMADRAK